jgi:hypothetical protein
VRRAQRGARPRARWTGSRALATMARIMARPAAPVRAVRPWVPWTCSWCSAWCLCWIGAARWRPEARTAHRSAGPRSARPAASPSARASRAGGKVPKDRPGSAARSSGTHAPLAARPISTPAACGVPQGRGSGRGARGRRARRGRPPEPGAILPCSPGQDTPSAPAPRALRPARATPPLLTARRTSPRRVSGLATTPVVARSARVCRRATHSPSGAPVSPLAPPAPRSGALVTIASVIVMCGEPASTALAPTPRADGARHRPRDWRGALPDRPAATPRRPMQQRPAGPCLGGGRWGASGPAGRRSTIPPSPPVGTMTCQIRRSAPRMITRVALQQGTWAPTAWALSHSLVRSRRHRPWGSR